MFGVPLVRLIEDGCDAGSPCPASLTYSSRMSTETILSLHPQPQLVCAGPEQKTSVYLQSLVPPCAERHLVQGSPQPSSSLLAGNVFWQDKREFYSE